jgi:hypothetical protein
MGEFRFTWAWWGLLIPCSIAAPELEPAEDLYRLDHVVVSYAGVGQAYAQAIARTVQSARYVAIEQFGFDLPDVIHVTISTEPKAPVRLFNDGVDRIYLSVQSEDDLRQPSKSGRFHIYGVCHELGHIAMYRLIPKHRWLSTAGAEGWAHYFGSRLVDGVFAREGPDLWPDRYEYIEDGMKRFDRQLDAPNSTAMVQAARAWAGFLRIVGDRGASAVFQTWGTVTVDPMDPEKALQTGFTRAPDAARDLAEWWESAQPILVEKAEKSRFAVRVAKKQELQGQAREIALDDNEPAGKKSVAGSAHAVRLEVEGDSWYLTSVKIYGSRYGAAAPPAENFFVWLCDEEFNVISEFPFLYARFKRGQPEWVTLNVEPTNVPPKFVLCIGFDPNATKGVYLSYDRERNGESLTGLPGRKFTPFPAGDWMIRAKVDQLKAINPL